MGFFDFFKKKSNDNIFFTSGRPQRVDPPAKQGWYRFLNKKSGEYDYTGISNNLQRRAKEHLRTGKFNPFKHIFEHKVENVPYDLLRGKEISKIKKYGFPLLNKNIGGGGRAPNISSNNQNAAISALGSLIKFVLKKALK